MTRHVTEPSGTTAARAAARAFAADVVRGLSDRPRWLPCHYLYDALGSELFEAITTAPEYYLTRTEVAILAESADAIAAATGPVTLMELGAGTSAKTGRLLAAYRRAGHAPRYLPVDVSDSALEAGQKALRRAYPDAAIEPVHATNDAALRMLRSLSPVMLVFLGSSIGNLDRTEARLFWHKVSRRLAPGDHVLLGVDLVKDAATINAAYNDAAGHSAAFTCNLFARMNRELGAGLDLAAISHEAAYHPESRQVEIFARFTRAQTITLAPLDRRITIAADERIRTEISRKYVVDDLVAYLDTFGLRTVATFTDPRQWFAELLLRRAS